MVILLNQILGYSATGALISLVHATISAVFILFHFDVYVANLIAFTCCFPVSVFLNKRLVFQSNSPVTARAYLIVYFVTLVIASSTILVRQYVDLIAVDDRLVWVEHIVTQGIFSVSVFLMFKWFLMR